MICNGVHGKDDMAKTAVISGVGSGLGASLAVRFADEGYDTALLARSSGFINSLAQQLREAGRDSLAIAADVTDPAQVGDAFARVREELGEVDVLINHAGNAAWGDFDRLTAAEFERSWRVCALGSFLCSKEAAGPMAARGSGAILFTGATSSIRGRAGALAFSSAKFAVRGLAWSLARELWPQGVHVAHVIIDGLLDTPQLREAGVDADEPVMDTDAVAETYWNLANQKPGAWAFEIDLRAHREDFFG